MPKPPQHKGVSASLPRTSATGARFARAITAVLCASLALSFAFFGCNRSEVKESEKTTTEESAEQESMTRSATLIPGTTREVYATWYDVPLDSLAKRRAAPNELTAAHNRLPLGTLVRVTHLKNGKAVTVRITDRGIKSRRVKLDVCKEAAEELEMVSKGVARVRMEILTDENGASPAEARASAPQP